MSNNICKQCQQRPTASEQNEYCEDCFAYNFLHDDTDFDDTDFDDGEDFEECPDCDGHDACRDFGCAIQLGLGHLVKHPL